MSCGTRISTECRTPILYGPDRKKERMRRKRTFLLVLAIFVVSATAPELYAADKPGLEHSRDSIIRIVTQIKRADYEGDRPALRRLHDELTPVPEDNKLASRVLYWRGFALWRRAINGFNETPTPEDLEGDLTQAITDFKAAIASQPAFVEPKIGEASCLGNVMYLRRKDPTRAQELLQQSSPLFKEAMATAPDNPRLLWVLGPVRWSSPSDRGGGQDKAFEGYNRGLEAVRNQKRDASDPLEPSWGEPELLMSLAWSYLNRTTPDLNAAEQDAQAALKIVPYWHYVRDILMPQIRAAQAKALPPVAGSALAQSQTQPNARSGLTAFGDGSAAFEAFKGFSGTWSIQSGDKTLPFKMTYDTGSKDSIVTELFGRELSVFYRDGQNLLMTHFCNAGNQPRLRLKESNRPGYFEFEMFDITSLADPQESAHFHRAIYQVLDDKRIKLELVWKKGKSEESENYILTRN
jgi:hypothetical protein